MIKKIIFAVSLLTLFMCENSQKEMSNFNNEEYSVEAVTEPNSSSMSVKSDENIPKDRKLIWSADISFQVEDVDQTSEKIKNFTSKYGGFISGMNVTTNNYRISNNITIRVPHSNFDKLISALKQESKYLSDLNINSNDVTEEFVDIESRLKTKKEARERYIQILKTKSGSVKDIIEAEDAIRKITEEIEAKEGRLRYLKDKVSLSTINLEIYQEVEFKKEPSVFKTSFFDEILDSLENGLSIIKSLFLLLLNIWPFLLVGIGVLIWKRKRIFGRSKN